LASNESPLGVSNEVIAAVTSAINRGNRYPDPLADGLRKELGALHGVDPEQVLVGNGSDELIYLLSTAFLARGGHAVCADPAYRIDELSAQIVGARVTKLPLRDWAHDLDAMSKVSADIAYVVNPHNPTGTVRDRGAIEQFVHEAKSDLIVVDEAYIDFVDDPAAGTTVPLLETGRVAVLRTFSKVYGLAGLRIGYLIGSRNVVKTLRKVRAPFSVDALSQAAASAALRDVDYRDRVREQMLRARPEVTRIFTRAGFEVVPSQANFVLVVAPDELALVATLESHGINVRPGSALGAPGTIRVSLPSNGGLRLLERWLASRL
jgi:histidinol-phosphate aminotransferase